MTFPTYARKTSDKTARPLKYLDALGVTVAKHLPETTDPTVRKPAQVFKTYRLRPQIVALIDALGKRMEARTGTPLSHSEILAAVLIEGLPAVASRESGR